jgi:ankyrin repeat protein
VGKSPNNKLEPIYIVSNNRVATMVIKDGLHDILRLNRAWSLCFVGFYVLLVIIGCSTQNNYNDRADKALWKAALSGDIKGAKQAIIDGASVDRRNYSLSEKGSWTILMRVIYGRGDSEMVRILIEGGADVNAKSNKGATPLTLAAEKGHVNTARLLLSHGANINEKNDFGNTALMYAAEFGHPELVKVFLNSRADVTPKDASGETALMIAKRRGYRKIQTLLINAGANE